MILAITIHNRTDDRVERYSRVAGKCEVILPYLSAYGGVTLIYGAIDEQHNNAVALRELLKTHSASAK